MVPRWRRYESASQCDVGLRDSFVDPTKYSSMYPGRRVVLYDQKLDVDSSRIYISSKRTPAVAEPKESGQKSGLRGIRHRYRVFNLGTSKLKYPVCTVGESRTNRKVQAY